MQAVLACTGAKPIKATGSPVLVGFINPQGDPNGSFPDATAGGEAAVDYINNELGGIGGNPLKGIAGHPIKLATCFETIAPSSSTSCANQVAAQKPAIIISGYQFFGSVVDPIYKAAGIPVVNYSPITPADFEGTNVYDIAAGGGCVGCAPGVGVLCRVQPARQKHRHPVVQYRPGRAVLLRPRAEDDQRDQRVDQADPGRCQGGARRRRARVPDPARLAGRLRGSGADPGPKAGCDHLLGSGVGLLQPAQRPVQPGLDGARRFR